MKSATIVTYPGGSTAEAASVTAIHDNGDRRVVVTDITPFHPLDPWWPDQPSDLGTMTLADHVGAIERAVLVGCGEGAPTVRIGDSQGIKRSDPSWVWSVGHVIPSTAAPQILPGDTCRLEVDPVYRRAIATGHTACHIAALGLNIALTPYWKKSTRTDALGNNDFDQEAIFLSTIGEFNSADHYRIGRSMRKAGFSAEAFWERFDQTAPEVAQRANDLLREIESITVSPDRTPFHARRTWIAKYKGRELSIPCGGVHIADPRELKSIEIDFSRSQDPSEFVMHTRVAAAG